jgi:hypothetical protein
MIKQKIIILIAVFVFCSFYSFEIFAQEGNDLINNDENNEVDEEEEKRHLITVAVGLTYVPKAEREENNPGIFIPSVGLDYFYRINRKWEIGTMIDFEIDKYFVPDVQETGIEREYVFIATLVGAYSILPGWSVFAGFGFETDKHHTLRVIRLGTEYQFKLGKNGWVLGPGAFVDIKEEYSAYSLSLAVGKNFGKSVD